MDSDTDWSESALFSPSKARAQQAQAKDWAFVEAWLSKRYATKRLPTFERNEDTLRALLTLATLNEGADEQRVLVDRVDKVALQSLSKRNSSVTEDVYQSLVSELHSGHLDVLSQTIVALDCPEVSAAGAAMSIIGLTTSIFEAQQQAQRVETQLNALRTEQKRMTELMTQLKQDSFQPPPALTEQTPEWVRSTKHLKAKIPEYDERLGTMRTGQLDNSSLDVVEKQREHLDSERRRLDVLHAELGAFEELPADTKLARAKLEGAREQLRSFTQKRDRLFERMVGDD